MAAIIWAHVVGIYPEAEGVDPIHQNAILAMVNTGLNVASFGGEASHKLRMARLYLAAHHAELSLPAAEETAAQAAGISSKTVSADSLSVSYAAPDTGSTGASLFWDLSSTKWGDQYKMLVRSNPGTRMPRVV